MTTPAQHKRDQATARVARLQEGLRAGLAGLPALADDQERTAALDRLVDQAGDLLTTEREVEAAAEQVRLARLEARRVGTQRMALYLATLPVGVGLVAGALMLFGGISAVWVLLVLPLLVAGLRIALGPVGPTPLMVDRRLRAAYTGAAAGVLTAAALLDLSGVAGAVLIPLAALAAVATVLFLVQEVR
ncbi:hypothetical protein [Amycolatopsis saalfeldensis]|uniref:Uncharacterized protein n=1 Tax=Amycolatopsis saalfeldensis TaxID=394193 RepID=A0A1H8Y5P7_9PSEU|nr:hypothetical protein [Amycolatopsis saalfeldensis]SEP47402.1 hypothetical protein SAMN04489732_111120 [Amycolatopsis saalfeldensis]